MGLVDRRPRLLGLQPTAYATLVTALERGWTTDAELREHAPMARPPTVQVKTAHTYPPDGAEALAAIRESGGTVMTMTDDEALAGMRELGARDGLYVEPSSGVIVAAVRRLVAEGLVAPDGSVVGLACGGGHRETPAVASSIRAKPTDVSRAGLAEALAGH
jgi:threonine synthase